MTRWARGGTANKKKPLEASSWVDMSAGHASNSKCNQREETDQPISGKSTKASKKRKRVECSSASNVECSEKKEKTSGALKSTVTAKPKMDILFELENERKGKVELLEHIRKDKRREARRVKRVDARQKSRLCFKCRKSGHDVSECPNVVDDFECPTNICFKCGSTEHVITQCKARVPEGKFPYAKCFICGEQGHISRRCPENPRGLYPDGGCCRLCESVEHFQKDCPTLQKKEDTVVVKLSTFKQSASLDDDEEILTLLRKTDPPSIKRGPKVITF